MKYRIFKNNYPAKLAPQKLEKQEKASFFSSGSSLPTRPSRVS
jgi:hypothetical protein